MASIHERKNKTTGAVTYQVQVRRKGYPPISKNFPTEQEARDFATLTEAGVLTNAVVNPRESTKWTIPEVIDWYIKNPNPQRKLETKKHFNRLEFLKEEFKKFTVLSLNAKMLSKWIQKRLEINEASTVYHYYVALKNVLVHHSVQHGYTQDIFNVVKCPTGSNERDRRFSIEETAKLFKSINNINRVKRNELRITVLFAIETACRIGEILKLKWSEVNINSQYIDLLAKNTKTKTHRRVPITTTAKKILLWIQKNHNPEKRKDKRVFDFYNLNEHHLSRQFKISCTKAGIENIRFHDLRHESTSRFYEKAPHLTDMEIASITGHKNLNMLKRYAHLRPSTIVAKLW